jgi:tetratricopeptide (TPR) repeat protein
MIGRSHNLLAGFVAGAVIAAFALLAPNPVLADVGLDDPPPQSFGPAPDGEGDPAARHPVETLLDRLAEASDESEARQLERMIGHHWRQSGSSTVDLLLSRAAEAIEEENYGIAIEFLDTIVRLAPEFAEGWNMRATVYFRIDEYQRAINDIGRTLSLQPRHFGALSGLGMIFHRLDDKERALSALRQALDVHPHLRNIGPLVERLRIEVEGRDI